MTVATKRIDSFEGQFEHVIDQPKNNTSGRCPYCGTPGTWKAQGKTKGAYGITKNFYIGMPYKEKGAVIRYLECEKIFRMDELAEEDGLKMAGAGERCTLIEVARMYVEEGSKRIQTDYHKYSHYSGENFWDDCNLCGMNNIPVNSAVVHEGTWKMLEGTVLQYSGAQQFAKEYREIKLMDYMKRYMEYPQLEMITKMGLYGVAKSMTDCRIGIISQQYAKKPEDFLGIRKERIKLLIRKKGDISYLDAMKTERRMGQNWTEKELEMVKETGIGREDLELALEHMSMKQLVNRIEQYSGVNIEVEGELCSKAAVNVRSAARTYFDYLRMRQQRGYDLDNQIFLHPRNLQRAHDQMVLEINREEIEKRDNEVEEKYPNIKKNYRKLRNRYFYEDEDYLIRPAQSAQEITWEGRSLHHCVGGNTYLSRHNKGESVILFLRKKDSPETPYITVEIQGTKILQWYGAYDRKPDEENMGRWLKEYRQKLEEKEIMIAAAV